MQVKEYVYNEVVYNLKEKLLIYAATCKLMGNSVTILLTIIIIRNNDAYEKQHQEALNSTLHVAANLKLHYTQQPVFKVCDFSFSKCSIERKHTI